MIDNCLGVTAIEIEAVSIVMGLLRVLGNQAIKKPVFDNRNT